MKLKNILLLAVLAVLLGLGAWWNVRRQPLAPAVIGARVLPVFDLNAVTRINILAPGTNFTLAWTGGVWTAVSRLNYPAKFDKVVECIRELDNLKVGQTVATANPGALGLLTPPAEGAPATNGQYGTLIRLYNDQGRLLASLLIGKQFMRRPAEGASAGMPGGMPGGYPDGQYVGAGGRVFLISRTLNRLTENTRYWLDDEFVNAPAEELRELNITGPGRAPLRLRRAGDNEPLALADLDPAEGAVDAAQVNRLAGALGYLGFDDLAPPALTAREAGLDQPVVVQARTRAGRRYTLHIGRQLADDNPDRYVQVSVGFEPPPAGTNAPALPAAEAAPTAEAAGGEAARAQALNAKLSSWIYTLKSWRVEPLLLTRADLIRKPEPPAGTNAPAATPPAATPLAKPDQS